MIKENRNVSGVITLLIQKIGGIIAGETIKGRRSLFYVEKGFQKSFVLFFLVLISVLIVSSGAVFFLIINNVLEQNMYTSHPTVGSMSEIFMPNLILYFIEITAISMIVVIFAVDRVLKKTARSLGIYERIAERLIQLDLKKAAAVEADQFFSLHIQYMDLIGKLSADIVLLREKTTRMGRLLRSLEEDSMTKEQSAVLWKEMAELKAAIGSTLTAYTVERG
jgi:methyl-accepting chemotaxis protein